MTAHLPANSQDGLWAAPTLAMAGSAKAAARVKQWLGCLPPIASSSRYSARLLAVAHLCDLLESHGNPKAELCVPRIMAEMDSPDLISGNIFASVLACAAMLRHAPPSGPLPSVTTYLSLLKELIANGNNATATIASCALHGPACAQFIVAPASPGEIMGLRQLLRSGRGSDLNTVLSVLERATHFGTIEIAHDPLLAILLDGVAMAALHKYDLVLGMRCMRARRYMGRPDPVMARMGLDILQASQREDGSFGDYENTLAQHPDTPELLIRLKLTVAFDALWTMAECEGGQFLLVNRAFGGSGLLAM